MSRRTERYSGDTLLNSSFSGLASAFSALKNVSFSSLDRNSSLPGGRPLLSCLRSVWYSSSDKSLAESPGRSSMISSNGCGFYRNIIFSLQMCFGAAPFIILRPFYDSRLHRVQFYISCGSNQILLIHWKGSESPLPKAPFPSFLEINTAGIPAMCFTDRTP